MTSKAGISGASLVACLLLWAQVVSGQYKGPIAALTPPTGNSPKIALKATDLQEVRTCVDGFWTLNHGYAQLKDATTNQVVGNYTSMVDNAGTLMAFTLFSSSGDFLESGDHASVVRARPIAIASGSNPPSLLEAVSHQNMGSAAAVSYIQAYNIRGDDNSARGSCSQAKASRTVTFTADFSLWTQDPLPASVPRQLQPAGRVIDGFFGKGTITYRCDGSSWTEISRAGWLHNLPGTPVLGQFWERNGVQSWQIYDPNGFTVYAKRDSPNMRISPASTAWTLSRVTSTPTSRWSLGRLSDVQTASTRGGLPPNATASGMVRGMEKSVGFSAIYWFYTNDFPLLTPRT